MRRCVKVPEIMQMEKVECGAASLSMILAYYRLWVPLEELRGECGVSRDGATAGNLLKAARSYGLSAKAYQCEIEDLKKETQFPCILHWELCHFVVLCGFKRGKAIINDPDKGRVAVTMEELDRAFTGICLCFEPGEDFKPQGSRGSILSFARERLQSGKDAYALIALACLAVTLLEVVRPAFSQVFLDSVLGGYDEKWLFLLAAGVTAAAFLKFLADAVSEIYLRKAEGKFAVTANAEYIWHVLRLPMEFFSRRYAGDISERQQSNQEIASSLMRRFAPAAVNMVLLICYLAAMLRYNVFLSLVGVLSVLVNLMLMNRSAKKRIQIARVQLRDLGKLRTAEVSGIEMIETIKAGGVESGYFSKWAGLRAAVDTSNLTKAKVAQYSESMQMLVNSLTNGVILISGSWMILDGHFTMGMLIAFQGLLAGFMSPAKQVMDAGQELQEMRTNMERIQDIMKCRPDIVYEKKEEENKEYAKLTGSVSLRGLTFGYSRLAKPLIQDFSLEVEPGEKIAVVGESGCGKSTIAKLISGLYKPWEGAVFLGGQELSKIDKAVLTGSLAVVDQKIVMFEDTIANNIKMWDESIEDYEMILAARDAQIHEDIMKREDGYQTMVSEGGRNLSGGQRQRIEIARVLAGDPRIIIMDEATSALDAQTEALVVQAVADRGITCIVVAHRLSTIRDCDKILVMHKGRIVEQGTHSELYEKNGYYTRLVTTE